MRIPSISRRYLVTYRENNGSGKHIIIVDIVDDSKIENFEAKVGFKAGCFIGEILDVKYLREIKTVH